MNVHLINNSYFEKYVALLFVGMVKTDKYKVSLAVRHFGRRDTARYHLVLSILFTSGHNRIAVNF